MPSIHEKGESLIQEAAIMEIKSNFLYNEHALDYEVGVHYPKCQNIGR